MNKEYMKDTLTLFVICCLTLIASCTNTDPNVDQEGTDEFEALEVEQFTERPRQNYQDVVYVPIYSDIYANQTDQKVLLSATLSIRNTSEIDSLFISRIDYFDTGGNVVRSYVENLISLPPMATINYVIEKEDDTGGPGANFIVELSAEHRNVKPLIQAVMVSYVGNKAFAFSVDGYSVK